MTFDPKDIYFMRAALKQAGKAFSNNDVPVGAVLVSDAKIIASSYNKVELKSNSTSHAEINVINSAIKKLKYKHLLGSTLYVTLEPCPMCAGAIVMARIKRIVYGANDPKTGAINSLFSIADDKRLNHRCEISSGILAEECSSLLTEFFKSLREKK